MREIGEHTRHRDRGDDTTGGKVTKIDEIIGLAKRIGWAIVAVILEVLCSGRFTDDEHSKLRGHKKRSV